MNPRLSLVGAMAQSTAILATIAIFLGVGSRRVFHRWPRATVILALVIAGLAGLASGIALDRFETNEREMRRPLTTAEVEHKLLATLFPNGAIQTAPPDDRTVCHDWTFGGTRYSDGCSVASLLADYEPVIVPRPGDIVVYWGPSDEPVHSGIVRALGTMGLTVIESKWGHMGRYLHLTEVSHFPSRYSYLRKRSEGTLPSFVIKAEKAPAAEAHR